MVSTPAGRPGRHARPPKHSRPDESNQDRRKRPREDRLAARSNRGRRVESLFEGPRNRRDAVESARRVAIETAQDRRLPEYVEIRNERARRRRIVLKTLDRCAERGVGTKWPDTRHHLVHHDAERVLIGGRSRRVSLDLFRRHVRRRSGARCRKGCRACLTVADGPRPGEAEVRHHRAHLAARTRHEHDVAALEVAVQDPCLMRCGQSRCELFDDGQRLGCGEPSVAVQPFRERLPFQQLHRHERDIRARRGGSGVIGWPMAEDVEHATDVRMRDPSRELNLVLESARASRASSAISGRIVLSATRSPSSRSSAS